MWYSMQEKIEKEGSSIKTKLWSKCHPKKVPQKNKIKIIIAQLKEYLPLETISFIERQLALHKVTKAQCRYAVKDKMMALSIFYQSRKAYNLLSKLFALPSKWTLQKSLQNTNILPGFNKAILDTLQIKIVSMDQKDRFVALVFDEMSLKSALVYNHGLDKIEGFEELGELGTSQFVADHALVFMVWGLHAKYKQPLGYFLTAGTVKAEALQKLMRSFLDKLEAIGLHTKALICDQGSNNRSFLQKLKKVSIDKPCIVHNTNKVYTVYDPPHLLKNVRNNFMKSNNKYDSTEIKWEYVVDFYNIDKAMAIRMAPKLSDKNITLPPFTAVRVNLVPQTLIHSVAAGINTLLQWKMIFLMMPVQLQNLLKHLINCLMHSTALPLKVVTNTKNALSENSGHIPFLESCLRFLSKIRTLGNAVIPCTVGWQISVSSLMAIWKDLQCNGFKFFLTNQLNQDFLENIFSIIHGKGGFRDNPDPQQFRAAFRHVVVDKLFVHSSSANCAFDADKILLDISNVTILQKTNKPISTPQNIPNTDIIALTIPAPSIPKNNIMAYMAGYLLWRYPSDDCEMCTNILYIQNLPQSGPLSEYELLTFKAYRETNCLVYPSLLFFKICPIFGNIILCTVWRSNVSEWLAQNTVHKCWKRNATSPSMW